jgi:gliding motility-associated-like protein
MKINSYINLITMKTKVFNILTAGLLFVLPNMVFAQAPALGTTADFVLFSSVGAVTNVGTQYLTLLTGHVGANSGPITNFGNVDGNLYPGGPQSAAASADLIIAYNQLNATVATLFPGVLLGNGQTLTPGVHSCPAATTLNLELTLDGLGNPNAVFIFKIQGPLSTNANSKVKLVNGAKACNVFWKVEGLVDMGTGTTMRGTIIANNAAINISTGDTLEGRALSTDGAITVSGIFAYTPIGCGSPVLAGPLAPNLASANCFALFSSIGPVTNNIDPTLVRGDLGTNSGGTTGFNPLFVTGMIHPIPDAATASCATDLNNAYNYLNALPSDIILMAPALFGHNLVLTPHTYLLGAATALTDTLYLDAQGSPNAVFVIKINGAFSTSVNARVILRNGAQAKNVYWKIDGATDINSNTIFNGTIISAGAVNLQTNAFINGKVLTINGAVNTNAITVNIPLGTCGFNSPIVITEPTDQTVCVGNSASFVVSATGTALTYQWRKGNVSLVNGANISGATTPTLTINPAALIDAASNYNVIVSGTFPPSDTSINVSLFVNTAPVITSEPSDKLVCLGNSATFTVAATGSGITYQWKRGLINLINGATISGATTASLTVNPVTLLDTASNYYVVVSNGCAPNDTSILVSLNVGGSAITSEPTNQTVCPGASASFTVATSGTVLLYQWKKGFLNLINGGNISGANTATLTINPVNTADTASNYHVVITGTCPPNDTSVNAFLRLNNPIIITQPTPQATCSGGSASFSVSATGTGLTYQWRKGTVNLINGGNISGATTATLTINPTGAGDAATNYNVVISGACAPSATSINVALIIGGAIITTEPTNKVSCLGNSVSFSITAVGSSITYQWRKGNTNLINGGNISGTNTATLTINPVNISDVASNYNVIVSGSCAPNDTSINVSLMLNNPVITSEPSSKNACLGGVVTFTTAATGGSLNYQWRKGNANLINGGNVSGATTASLTINPVSASDAGTNYYVVVSGACAPNDTSIMVAVTINPSPVAIAGSNSQACEGTFINLTAQTVLVANYSWTGPNGFSSTSQNPVIADPTMFDAGTYSLNVTNSCGTATTTTDVIVINCDTLDFFIPEGFSPNGDGINDVFFIRGIQRYTSNTFTIFNRWGNKVYDTNNYQNTWNGNATTGVRIGGDELPVGTYFYVLDLNDGTPVYKGTIYLNR